MTHDEKREAIAAIVYPAGWDKAEIECAYYPAARKRLEAGRADALAKADAILALTSPPATSEIGAEYRRGLEDAANYLVGKAREMRGENPSPTAGMMARIFEEQATAIRSLAAAPSEPPPGWRLVPIEPTEAMLEAFWEAGDDCWGGTHHVVCKAVRAMLSAAPTPQTAEPDTSGYAEWADDAGRFGDE